MISLARIHPAVAVKVVRRLFNHRGTPEIRIEELMCVMLPVVSAGVIGWGCLTRPFCAKDAHRPVRDSLLVPISRGTAYELYQSVAVDTVTRLDMS